MPLPVEWRWTSGPFGPFGPYPSDFGPYPTLPYPTLTLGVRGFHPGENYCNDSDTCILCPDLAVSTCFVLMAFPVAGSLRGAQRLVSDFPQAGTSPEQPQRV